MCLVDVFEAGTSGDLFLASAANVGLVGAAVVVRSYRALLVHHALLDLSGLFGLAGAFGAISLRLFLVAHGHDGQHEVDQVERAEEDDDGKKYHMNWPARRDDHVVNVFPVVERDQLERGQHGPQQVVEARIAEIGVAAHVGKTRVAVGAAAGAARVAAQFGSLVGVEPVVFIQHPPMYINNVKYESIVACDFLLDSLRPISVGRFVHLENTFISKLTHVDLKTKKKESFVSSHIVCIGVSSIYSGRKKDKETFSVKAFPLLIFVVLRWTCCSLVSREA